MGEEKFCCFCEQPIPEHQPYIVKRTQLRSMVVRTNEEYVCTTCIPAYFSLLVSLFGDNVILNQPQERTGQEFTPDGQEHTCFHCGEPIKWSCHVLNARDSTNKILTQTIYVCSNCMQLYWEDLRQIKKQLPA